MKIRIVVGSLALGAVILLWPLLWTGLNAGTLLRQEPDAAQLFRLTPKALLLGAAFTPVAEPQSIRVLTRNQRKKYLRGAVEPARVAAACPRRLKLAVAQ